MGASQAGGQACRPLQAWGGQALPSLAAAGSSRLSAPPQPAREEPPPLLSERPPSIRPWMVPGSL